MCAAADARLMLLRELCAAAAAPCVRGWWCSSLGGERCHPAVACVRSVSGLWGAELRYVRGCARNVFGEMSEKNGECRYVPGEMGERSGHVWAMSANKWGPNLRFVVGDVLTPCLLVPEKTNVAILLSRVNFVFEEVQMLRVSMY